MQQSVAQRFGFGFREGAGQEQHPHPDAEVPGEGDEFDPDGVDVPLPGRRFNPVLLWGRPGAAVPASPPVRFPG